MNNNNKVLKKATKKKDDEFYTRYIDVEKELKHYWSYLKDKVIYCPCDIDKSAFVKYLQDNKNNIGYKKLYYTSLSSGCDFQKQDNSFADVIITNPPFSLFMEFMDWVGDKDCIVLGPNTASGYKNIFPKIFSGKLKFGTLYNKTMYFDRPDGSIKDVAIGWYTTFPARQNKPLQLKTKAENEANGVVYKKFDNYDAINVDRTKDIPSDYNDLMGVPITFLDKWDPSQFELIDCIARYSVLHNEETRKEGKYLTMVDGKPKFSRVIIKKIS